jgi:hypothetical protein
MKPSELLSRVLLCAILASLILTLPPSLNAIPTPATDASCKNASLATTSLTCTLNNVAGVYVLVGVSKDNNPGYLVTSITVGSTSLKHLTTFRVALELWGGSVSAVGPNTVTVNFAPNMGAAFWVESFTGSNGVIEDLTTASGTGTTASVTVPSGTTGRLVIQHVGLQATPLGPTVTAGIGQTEFVQENVDHSDLRFLSGIVIICAGSSRQNYNNNNYDGR